MLVEKVKKLSSVQRFIYWIMERDAIRQRRAAGKPKPWTDDVVLQSVFFTHPYREHDKVTVWFRDNIREPLRHNDRVLFATIAFRWFTWPSTATYLLDGLPWSNSRANLLYHWNTLEAVERLTYWKSMGQQIFTGAYNISNSGSSKPKINRVCEDYIAPAWEKVPELLQIFNNRNKYGETPLSMQEAHGVLRRLPGLGGSGFMAYEVVCDLRYTKFLELADDKDTWCNPGPGAKRGLNRILGQPITQKIHPTVWATETSDLLALCQQFCHEEKGMPRLEMREIEHSLCEWDKYERALYGTGHLKRLYKGTK